MRVEGKSEGGSRAATPAVGAQEAAGAEVAEDGGDGEGKQKVGVGFGVGGGAVEGVAKLPGGNAGGEGEEAEEDAGELEPEDAGEFDDRTPDGLAELAAAAGEASAGVADGAGGGRGGAGGTLRGGGRG